MVGSRRHKPKRRVRFPQLLPSRYRPVAGRLIVYQSTGVRFPVPAPAPARACSSTAERLAHNRDDLGSMPSGPTQRRPMMRAQRRRAAAGLRSPRSLSIGTAVVFRKCAKAGSFLP